MNDSNLTYHFLPLLFDELVTQSESESKIKRSEKKEENSNRWE